MGGTLVLSVTTSACFESTSKKYLNQVAVIGSATFQTILYLKLEALCGY